MKRLASLICSVIAATAMGTGAQASTTSDATRTTAQDTLFTTVSKLDTALFDSFNHCAIPAQAKRHASFFAPNLEFYHDMGGVTWSRHDYMENTVNHVCGQFRRKLVPGTLQVFPIKDYGAMEQGRQTFCWIKSGSCFAAAQFLILWRHQDGHWIVTRVFSYGHHHLR